MATIREIYRACKIYGTCMTGMHVHVNRYIADDTQQKQSEQRSKLMNCSPS